MKTRLCCLALSSTLALSGCAGMSDSNMTKAQGAGAGAAGGAVLGGVLGQVFGQDAKSTIIGGAIGGAIGAGAGYLYGTHVAQQKEKYASQEDWLDACIASAEKTNEETKAYNRQLAGEIETLKEKSSKLQKKYKAKKASKADMVVLKSRIDQTSSQAEEALKKAKFELQNQISVAEQINRGDAPEQSKALDKRITSLKKSINELEEKTDSLAALSVTMGV